jgi:hypothetical protein
MRTDARAWPVLFLCVHSFGRAAPACPVPSKPRHGNPDYRERSARWCAARHVLAVWAQGGRIRSRLFILNPLTDRKGSRLKGPR